MFKSENKTGLSLTAKALLSLTVAIAAGCANDGPPVRPAPDPIEVRLTEYAEAASISLRQLAQVEKVVRKEKSTDPVDPPALSAAVTPEPRRLPVPVKPKFVAPEGMGAKNEISWNGPLDQFLVQVSELSGYQLKVYGILPRLPIYVVIKPNGTDTLMDALVDASQQAGPTADIVLKPNGSPKVIELRYLGVKGK